MLRSALPWMWIGLAGCLGVVETYLLAPESSAAGAAPEVHDGHDTPEEEVEELEYPVETVPSDPCEVDLAGCMDSVPPPEQREELDDRFLDVVAVRFGSKGWSCSGVVVHPRLVLTARHCMFRQQGAGQVAIRPDAIWFGDAVDSDNGVLRRLSRDSVVHLPPSDGDHQPDLMLIELEQTVADIDGLVIRRLFGDAWGGFDSLPGDDPVPFVVVGFGAFDKAGTLGSGRKRYAVIEEGDWHCAGHVAGQTGCAPDQEVVVGRSTTSDTCDGDSGGPLFVYHDKKLKLAGVTSRAATPGGGCGFGGVYQRVDRVEDWVLDVVERTSQLPG